MGLFNFESVVSRRLRKEWNIPDKIKYKYLYDNGNGQKEYLVEIKPRMNDFGMRNDEKIYATISLIQILERTYVPVCFIGWRSKIISKKIISDKFFLNKGRNEFATFKSNFSIKSGLEEDLIEEVFDKEINKLINFRKLNIYGKD